MKYKHFDYDGFEELALDPQIRQGARHAAGGHRRDAKIIERHVVPANVVHEILFSTRGRSRLVLLYFSYNYYTLQWSPRRESFTAGADPQSSAHRTFPIALIEVSQLCLSEAGKMLTIVPRPRRSMSTLSSGSRLPISDELSMYYERDPQFEPTEGGSDVSSQFPRYF